MEKATLTDIVDPAMVDLGQKVMVDPVMAVALSLAKDIVMADTDQEILITEVN